MLSKEFEKDIDVNVLRPTKRLWWVMFFLRLEQKLNFHVLKRVCAAFKKIFLIGTCCELPAAALTGGGINFPHLNGIIISSYAQIGSNCRIYQQVTVGVNEFKDEYKSAFIGDRVYIGAGAKIIGPVIIGNDVVIGANAVVTKDIPEGSIVVGANKILTKC